MRPLLFLFFLGVFGSANAQNPIVQKTAIFPGQDKHVHGSSIVALPNGDFLAAWFEGSGERTADDVKIMGARLKKGQQKWSTPFLLADTEGLPDCNPVLFFNKSGTLFLAWIAVQANRWEHSIIKFRTSKKFNGNAAPEWEWQDNILLKPGEDFATETAEKMNSLPKLHRGWSEYAPAYDDMIIDAAKDATKRSAGWMTRIKPLITPTGRIILPLYSDGFNFSMMAISDDDGKTWYPSKPVVGRGPIQPALAQKKDGTIVAFMRDSGDAPNKVHKSESKDNGISWTATQLTDIPNTASVEALVLSNGKWAFLGNDVSDGRYRMSLYLSDDEGAIWKQKLILDEQPKGNPGFSYPSLIQTNDGLLHITYSIHGNKGDKTIQYVVVNAGLVK